MASIGLAGFTEYVEDLPSQSRCWRGGSRGLYPFLGWLNTQPVVLQRELIAEHGVHLAAMMSTRAFHNQVGITVAWATRYMTGPTQDVPSPFRDLEKLFDLAGRVYLVRNLLAEVRQGVRTFEATRRRIEMKFVGDARLDALDRLMALVDDITQDDPTGRWSVASRQWLRDHGTDTAWNAVPESIRAEFRASAHDLMATYPRYLPPGLDVGGFTVGDASSVLEELLARGQHMMAATILGSTDVATTVPCFEVGAFVDDLALQTGIPPERVAIICALLTVDLDRCPDPCLTPLVPLGDDFPYGPGFVVPMSALIVPSSPHRNFTALLQVEPARLGAAGKALGSLGAETVAATLRNRLRDAVVATGVRLVRGDRTHAGDLDVVACDPASRTMAIFEVMWRIGPDGSAEVAAVEEDAHAKRQQVSRIRVEMANGDATARWPHHWPDVREFDVSWFIVSPNVLPVRAVDPDGILVRSHQLIARMLPCSRATSSPSRPVGVGNPDSRPGRIVRPAVHRTREPADPPDRRT